MTTLFTTMPTTLGDLLVARDDDGLTRASFLAGTAAWTPPTDALRGDDDALLVEARAQLAAYFAGRLRAFDLPLAPRGTPFQRDVWRALAAVPYGATTTYGALAATLGRPTAARAVGAANGANPLPVVVPCHRVVGADGSLTGYLGGVPLQRALLVLEGG
jgi:methylated-DNA-[protein]-cysteine S-methyltransferase